MNPAPAEPDLFDKYNHAFETILAAFNDESVLCSPLPRGILFRANDHPIMCFASWCGLHEAIDNRRKTIGEVPLLSAPIDSVSPQMNCASFEALAFRTWGYFMSLFCAPSARLPRTLHCDLQRWLPEFKFQLISVTLSEPPAHPHDQRDSCLGAVERQKLSEELRLTIGELGPGRAVWVRLTSSTPFHFILVARPPSHYRASLAIRFVDSKPHTEGCPSVTLPSARHLDLEDEPPQLASSIIDSARALHERLITPIMSVGIPVEAFDASHVIIASNQANCPESRAVSPRTFTWHPWSTFLFAMDRAP